MRPRQQAYRDRFCPANRPPNGWDAMPPNCSRISKTCESNVMHQIERTFAVQPGYNSPNRFLPKDVVKLESETTPAQTLHTLRKRVKNEPWLGLVVPQPRQF